MAAAVPGSALGWLVGTATITSSCATSGVELGKKAAGPDTGTGNGLRSVF